MDIVLLIVTAVVVLYMTVFMYKSIPESLSATYYMSGSRSWVFVLFMVSVAVLLYPVWLSVSQESHRFLVFLSCASLLFVASSPCFREELQGKVHYSAAAVCCLCVFLWQILEGLWDVTLCFVFIAGILILQNRTKWCWWLECAAIGSLLANLWRLMI